jgi:hypothetical protein
MKKNIMRIAFFFLVVVALTFAWHFTLASAAGTIIIPDRYSTIQQGIDAAVAGDTVLVRDGTYLISAALDFKGKAITVKSEHGPSSCFLDGQQTRVVYFHTSEGTASILDGFTIEYGDAGYGGQGGGILCSASSPSITHCVIRANSAVWGGGISINKASPLITDSVVTGNSSALGGGGIHSESSTPTIINTVISYNSSTEPIATGGGALFSGSTPTLVNCIINGNTAVGGGAGLFFNGSSSFSILTNCTIVRNTTPSSGGGIACSASSPRIFNAILWENSPDEVTGNPTITYSNVLGGYSGAGNIASNPIFMSISTGDFHLTASSPSINAGSNAALELHATDKEGNPRIANAIVDMGAYEYQSAAVVPSLDISMSKAAYINGDTVTATEFRFRNAGSAAVCELKVWLAIPGFGEIPLLNLGSDGSFVLPAAYNQNLGPISLFAVATSLPRGNYEFSSRIIKPSTGITLSSDLNPFVIQ